jgi:glucokinase
MRLLAGDIGGTKTSLALYEGAPGGYRTLRSASYASAEHASLGEVLARFFDGDALEVDAAAFGVAGPVRAGLCVTTNLPWQISQVELAERLHTKVGLVNDFHAVALGVRELGDEDLCMLNPVQRDPSGPFALIGAGTGLGEALGLPCPGGVHVVAGEGGHADFAPHNETEIRLLRFLLQRHGHVSWERVVSGLGLGDVYDFVVADGLAPADELTAARLLYEARATVIGERGLAGEDAAAGMALSLFVSLYGAEAGNLALRVLPTGGLYLAGGIVRKLLPRFTDGTFMANFLAKGRMSKILETIPVAVVRHEHVGLLGARAHAAVLCAH